MINIELITDFSRKNLLESFDPNSTTWLVPHLQQKLVLQQFIMPKFQVLPEQAFLRVNEFWQLLLKQNINQLKVVSNSWMQTRLDFWLEQQSWSVARSKGAGNILLQYIQHMLPALVADNGQELMSEWFQENPSAFVRWGHWAQLSFEAWSFIESENMLLAEWAPAFLNQLDEIVYDKKLIVDLNYALSPLESEVLLKLKSSQKIIVEHEFFKPEYKDDFLSYKLLEEKLNTKLQNNNEPKALDCSYHRFSSQLAEIKDLCAQIKKLIDKGVKPEKIAILAPKIEDYWALMYSFLKQEGIEPQKRQSIHLHSLPHIMTWFSTLHKRLKTPNFYDLETDFSSNFEDYNLNYQKLSQQFRSLNSQNDFKTVAKKHKLQTDHVEDKKASFEEFVEFATEFYKSEDTESLVMILSKAHLDLQSEVKMPFSQWLKYLQSLTSKIEVSERKLAEGLICENLESFHPWDQEYIFVLGLSDDNMKGHQSLCAINYYEVSSIGQSTGFYFQRPEAKSLEIKLHQIMHSTVPAKVQLSFAEADFLGGLQAPAKLWILKALDKAVDIQKIQNPDFCQWDYIQRQGPEELKDFRKYDSKQFGYQYTSIKQDMGLEPPDQVEVDLSSVNLSVSKMESYLRCPFIFTSEKLFSLQDLPDLDLDIDHMTSGKVMHALFEKIVNSKDFSYNQDRVQKYIEEICEKEEILFFEEFLKNNFFRKYQKLAESFMQFESNWRVEYSDTQTVGTELKIKSFWDIDKKQFNNSTGVMFNGSIDRVDTDKNGNYVIIDYKSSGFAQTNHGSWVKNKSLQLSLYALAVESGATSLPAGPVVGAFYFNVKEMSRDKGFQVNDIDQQLLTDKPNRYISITDKQKQELYSDVIELFDTSVKHLQAGGINPNPDDKKICTNCNWSELCRAPHLN